MRRTRAMLTRSAMLLSAAFVAPAAAVGASIGFNFVGLQTIPISTVVGPGIAVGPGEIAGVVPQSNWNNGVGAVGNQLNLLDSGGTPTTADLSWVSEGEWGGQQFGTTGDQHLTAGWLDDSRFGVTAFGVEVTVDQIPYDSYDLYIYVTSDGGNSFRRSRHVVNGEELVSISRWEDLNAEGTFFAGTHIDGSTGQDNHSYMVVRGLTDDTLSITGRRINTSPDGVIRGNIAGIQIVDTTIPEPSGMVIVAIAMLSAGAGFRRARRATRLAR